MRNDSYLQLKGYMYGLSNLAACFERYSGNEIIIEKLEGSNLKSSMITFLNKKIDEELETWPPNRIEKYGVSLLEAKENYKKFTDAKVYGFELIDDGKNEFKKIYDYYLNYLISHVKENVAEENFFEFCFDFIEEELGERIESAYQSDIFDNVLADLMSYIIYCKALIIKISGDYYLIIAGAWH